MIEWGVAVGIVFAVLLAALRPALVPIFTTDPDVRHLALQVLLIVAALQPLNAVVFVLDGVLIGAGDVTYLVLAMRRPPLFVLFPATTLFLSRRLGRSSLWGSWSPCSSAWSPGLPAA